MLKYNRATIAKKSGVRNLQAVVTVPIELREIVGRKQIGITTGTNDEKIARQRLPDLKAAEVIEKGTLIHKEYNTRYDEEAKRWYDSFTLHIAYNNVMYKCFIVGETNEVACFTFKDDGTY